MMPPAPESATITTKNTVNPSEYCVLGGAFISDARVAEAVIVLVTMPTGGSGLQNRSASAYSSRKFGALLG